jgi:hypothetical protein
MRYVHQAIVNNAAEIISRAAVAAKNYRIADLLRIDFDSAEHEIVESDYSFPDAQPHGRGRPGFLSGLHFGGRKIAALSRIALHFILSHLSLANLLQFFFGAEATESFAFIEQLLRVLLVEGISLSLTVGPEIASSLYSFVPLESQPLHILNELPLVFGFAPLGVGVFDAQDENAAMMSGEKPIKKSGPNIADM